MAPKLKYNVKGVERGGWVNPDPGLYSAKILDVTVGESKSGKDMITVHFQIKGGKFDGAKMRTWILIGEETSAWKVAEFVDAVGAPEQGDLNKLIRAAKGKVVQIKVDADTYNDQPTSRVGTIMPKNEDEDEDDEEELDLDEDDDEEDDEDLDEDEDDEDDEDEDVDEDDDDEEDLDEDDADDEDDEDDEEDEDEDDEDDDEDDDEEDDEDVDLKSLSLDELRDLAKQNGIKPTVKRKGEQLKGAALKKALIAKLEKALDPFA